MNKSDLRQSYIGAGWEVQPVAQWVKVSEVGGKTKYDVNAVSPDNVFGTAQVVVTDDGGASESAVAEGFWKEVSATFDAEVRGYVSSLEGGTVFAVAVTEVYSGDEIAEAKAYMDDGMVNNYVVKRRSGAFSFTQLV